MIKRKLTEADWFLLLANCVPVYGVWFLDWSAAEIFLAYCLETIIIGFFTLTKLGIATAVKKRDWWENGNSRTMVSGVFFMIFFILHYGLFVTVQMNIFFGISSMHAGNSPSLSQILFHPFSYVTRNIWIMLSIFVFSYGYENLSPFIVNKEYRTKSFARIMFEPYIRIFVQQFTVILGSFVLIFGAGKIFVLFFAAFKTFFTVFINYDRALELAEKKKNLEVK